MCHVCPLSYGTVSILFSLDFDETLHRTLEPKNKIEFAIVCITLQINYVVDIR